MRNNCIENHSELKTVISDHSVCPTHTTSGESLSVDSNEIGHVMTTATGSYEMECPPVLDNVMTASLKFKF